MIDYIVVINLSQFMHKWEQKNRIKQHQIAIEHASSVIKSQSRSKSIKSRDLSLRSKLNIPKKLNLKEQVPVIRILSLFGLQKYSKLLNHKQLILLIQSENSRTDIDRLINMAEPEDKQKLTSLVHTMIVMSKDIKKNPLKITKLKNSNKQLPQIKINNNRNSEKTVQRFRVRVKNSQQNTPDKKIVYKNIKKLKQVSSKDDSQYVHKLNINDHNELDDYIVQMVQNSQILKNLIQKVNKISNNQQNQMTIRIPVQQIKQMYQSFESGQLSSNIHDVDFQFLLVALSYSFVSCWNHRFLNLEQDKKQIIKSFLRESLLLSNQQNLDTQQAYQDDKQRDHKVEQYLNPQQIKIQKHIQFQNIFNFIQLVFMELQMPKSSLIYTYILLKNDERGYECKCWKILLLTALIASSNINFENIKLKSDDLMPMLELEESNNWYSYFVEKKKNIENLQYAKSYFQMRASVRHKIPQDKIHGISQANGRKLKLQTIFKTMNNEDSCQIKKQKVRKKSY